MLLGLSRQCNTQQLLALSAARGSRLLHCGSFACWVCHAGDQLHQWGPLHACDCLLHNAILRQSGQQQVANHVSRQQDINNAASVDSNHVVPATVIY
jgi:hypothetical protein